MFLRVRFRGWPSEIMAGRFGAVAAGMGLRGLGRRDPEAKGEHFNFDKTISYTFRFRWATTFIKTRQSLIGY